MSGSSSPFCAEGDNVWHVPEGRRSESGDVRCVPEETARKLRELAERYETAEFSDGDPSFILKRYTDAADVECSAFIAAVLAFGRREQFIPKIKCIFDEADRRGGPAEWLRSGSYKCFGVAVCGGSVEFAGDGTPSAGCDKKFYRFYSYSDMLCLFARLAEILEKHGTLGNCIRQQYERTTAKSTVKAAKSHSSQTAASKPDKSANNRTTDPERLLFALESVFSGCKVVPHGKTSAAKRLCMFLRWMVRQNSPVDTGLWSWAQPKNLIIPLDTHVLQESINMGLLPPAAVPSLKTALTLTTELREIWPDDPCKGDFALFGLGVDTPEIHKN